MRLLIFILSIVLLSCVKENEETLFKKENNIKKDSVIVDYRDKIVGVYICEVVNSNGSFCYFYISKNEKDSTINILNSLYNENYDCNIDAINVTARLKKTLKISNPNQVNTSKFCMNGLYGNFSNDSIFISTYNKYNDSYFKGKKYNPYKPNDIVIKIDYRRKVLSEYTGDITIKQYDTTLKKYNEKTIKYSRLKVEAAKNDSSIILTSEHTNLKGETYLSKNYSFGKNYIPSDIFTDYRLIKQLKGNFNYDNIYFEVSYTNCDSCYIKYSGKKSYW